MIPLNPMLKQYGRRLGALLLALLLLGACEKEPRITHLGPNSTVLAFGDSLTYGTGASRDQSYPSTLGQLLNCTVINAGIPGEVSSDGRRRLPQLLEKHRPDLLILCHGGNDLIRRLGTAQLAVNLREMVETARAAGADVIMVGVPAPGLSVQPPPLYGEIAEEYGLPYDDAILHELLTDRALKSDAIHPNAAGYRKLAEALAELIARAQRP